MSKKKHAWRVPGSGKPAVVMAVLLPMLFGGLTALLSALFPVDGPNNLEDVVDNSEDVLAILAGGAIAALVLSAVFGRKVVRGRGQLVPWLLCAAFLPWLCGVVGTELGMIQGLTAFEGSTTWGTPAIAKMLAIAGSSTYLGMVLTASLLLSTGLVLAIAADHFRTVVPGAGVRLLHGLMALPLFGLAAFCTEMRDPELAFPLAPAALMVLIGLLLAARASRQATDDRGFGLDTAAVLALGLGWFVTAEMVRWGASYDAYEALESAAPDSRGYLIERALANAIPIDTATRGVWAVLGLMLLVTARGAESAHRFGGAAGRTIAMAVVFCIVSFFVAEQRRFREDNLMKRAAVPTFAEIEGFRPVVSTDRYCCSEVGPHHAVVAPDRVWTWRGEKRAIDHLQSEAGRRSLARVFVALLEGEEPPPPRKPAPFNIWRYRERLERSGGSRSGDLLPTYPNLNLALDARLTPGQLASVLDAAGRAGANSVDITTLRGATEGYRHVPGLPVSYGGFPYPCSDRVHLARALSPELFARDANLLNTRLDDPGSTRIGFLRDGRPEEHVMSLEGDFEEEYFPSLPGRARVIYVRFGRATTPGALAQLSTRACEASYDVALVFGQPAALSAAVQYRRQQNR
jgi:hypothetical protein